MIATALTQTRPNSIKKPGAAKHLAASTCYTYLIPELSLLSSRNGVVASTLLNSPN